METIPFDLIEEYQTEDIMSVNHSRTIQRISFYLERYDDLYDILPELEMKLNGKPVKPDVSVYPNLPEDWDTDVIFITEPPLVAIEVLSPKQAMTDITDKINTIYFPAGVQSVWIVVPLLQTITIRTPDGQKLTFSDGIIKDPVIGIEIPFNQIFRKRSA
ncbi:MAG: Uma2 family endonuclease [Spirosomataceae bacterium]